jgi:hypothetical protein
MRRLTVVAPFALLALAACDRSHPQSSGQTGSIGPSPDECNVASDCDQRSTDEVAELRGPVAAGVSFSGAECVNLGIVDGPSGPACQCQVEGGSGTLTVGPVGLDCFALGRGGDCLWQGSDFDGCQVGEASACDTTCADLQQRLADDAAKELDVESVYDSCHEHTCHNVVRIGERCFADRSYNEGRSYDCALGGEAILTAHDADTTPAAKPPLPDTRMSYVEGTDGFVQLISSSQFIGTAPSYAAFGAMAQFAIIHGKGGDFGDIIDPLDGIDDCGVSKGSGAGVAANVDFYDAAEVELLDGKIVRPLSLSTASHDDFYQYVAELSDQGTAPRFGQSYGVKVAGGSFGAAFESSTLRLPDQLALSELQQSAHFDQKDLRLTWTGTGTQPVVRQDAGEREPDGSERRLSDRLRAERRRRVRDSGERARGRSSRFRERDLHSRGPAHRKVRRALAAAARASRSQPSVRAWTTLRSARFDCGVRNQRPSRAGRLREMRPLAAQLGRALPRLRGHVVRALHGVLRLRSSLHHLYRRRIQLTQRLRLPNHEVAAALRA